MEELIKAWKAYREEFAAQALRYIRALEESEYDTASGHRYIEVNGVRIVLYAPTQEPNFTDFMDFIASRSDSITPNHK